MMRSLASLAGSFAISSAVFLTAATASADTPMAAYTVVAGDDCYRVAQKLYGDRMRYDLIHKFNPQLGPPPHHYLTPGTVLNVPVSASPGAEADARMMFARNEVKVDAGDTRPARADDLLYRGNRVSTGERSSAGVDFRDDSQLFLAEDTLLVIYGDAGHSQRSTGTTLLTGNLRAHLGALAGKPIPTPSGVVQLGPGDAQIGVDAQKTTRLSVYKGTSSLTAQKKKVQVVAGYGTKADLGKPPERPRLLPLAPVWAMLPQRVLVSDDDGGILAAMYAAAPPGATGAPAVHQWHVQLARDEAFHETVVDTRVPATVTKLEEHAPPQGRYFARVSAIDDDSFEGPFGPVAVTDIVGVTNAAPANGHRVVTVTAPPTVRCELDGVPIDPGAPLTPTTDSPHRLSCQRPDNGADTGGVSFAATTVARPQTTAGALPAPVRR